MIFNKNKNNFEKKAACPSLTCLNQGNFNGFTCQCECIDGTSGTLCGKLLWLFSLNLLVY